MVALDGVGVWSHELRYADPADVIRAAQLLEALGYTALWLPDVGGPVFDAVDRILAVTSTVTVATGVLNVWMHTPDDVAQWWRTLPDEHRNRVVLGLGVSHAPLIGETWGRPLATMNDYLDGLDSGGVAQPHRCLAALGPKMVELSARRSAGAHTYLVTAEHTAQARATLGSAGLYVEQGVVLETDPATARGIARAALEVYCTLPNYVNNWKRLGFSDDEIGTRSDRLVDGLVAWGDVDAISARVEAHRQSGADHVCIQVLTARGASSAPTWEALAPQ